MTDTSINLITETNDSGQWQWNST